MSEMIEQIARALCTNHYAEQLGKPVDDGEVQLNVNGNWQLYTEDAKAAMKAMRAALNVAERRVMNAVEEETRACRERVFLAFQELQAEFR